MPVTRTENVYLYEDGIIIEVEVGTQTSNIFEVYNRAGDLISVEDSLEGAKDKLPVHEEGFVDAVLGVVAGIILVSTVFMGLSVCIL